MMGWQKYIPLEDRGKWLQANIKITREVRLQHGIDMTDFLLVKHTNLQVILADQRTTSTEIGGTSQGPGNPKLEEHITAKHDSKLFFGARASTSRTFPGLLKQSTPWH